MPRRYRGQLHFASDGGVRLQNATRESRTERRCARHPAPVLDLAMLGVRSFAMANVAALLFSAASLPPARFATGSAVLTMSRQIGAVLGVAVFVAVLGTPAAGDAVDAFRNGYAFMVIAAVLAAAAALAIGTVGSQRAARPLVPSSAADDRVT
jgi:hypothetical protein